MGTILYQWALAKHRHNSEQGKKVVELANAGVGYHVINQQRGKTDDIIVAFKRPITNFLPPHLTLANAAQTQKLDILDAKRRGAH